MKIDIHFLLLFLFDLFLLTAPLWMGEGTGEFLMLVGCFLSVVVVLYLISGSVFTKKFNKEKAKEEIYEEIKNATSEEEVDLLLKKLKNL